MIPSEEETAKPDKDTTSKENNRPIFLNRDKILNKYDQTKLINTLKGSDTMMRWDYPWNARMVQSAQINKCATPH